MTRTGVRGRTARSLCWVVLAIAVCGQRQLTAGAPERSVPPARPVKIPVEAVWKSFPDSVLSVAISPDGRTVAAGSYESLTLLQMSDRKEIATLPEKAGNVRSLAWSPDSRVLVVGSYQTVAVWDVAARKKIATLPEHLGYATSMAFSRDGKWLVTGCDDEFVRVWETANWKLKHKLAGHSKPVFGVAVSPDGTLIASCGGDDTKPTQSGELKLWELSSGKPVPFGETPERAQNTVAFSPDGKRLASAGFDEVIKLWEVPGGKLLHTLEGHSRPVNSVVFFPNGGMLVSTGGGRFTGGNDIRIWDSSTGLCRAVLQGHEGRVLQAIVTPDGKRILSGSGDATLRSWNLAKLLDNAAEKEKRPHPVVAVADKKADEKPADKKSDEKKPVDAKPVSPPAEKSNNGVSKESTPAKTKVLRAGMIGLDTSHCAAFAQILNAKDAPEDVAGCRLVAAYPKGSPDIVSSTSRVPEYTKKLESLGVKMVDSIPDLLTQVDVVFLETNDGRPHLEQVLPVLKAGKPVFIDKPIAGSLADAVAIFEAAKKYKTPVFSSSSLRFMKTLQEMRKGSQGAIYGCDVYSPCHLEKTHPDLYWYGVHGVEMLYTVMGTGCEQVSRVTTPETDVAVGVWKGGRVGTFRGIRHKKGGYGGTVFTEKGIVPTGNDVGYRVLVVEIVKFFRTGKVPVAEAETLELFAFMTAADESKKAGGAPVKIAPLLEAARKEAAKLLPK